MRRKARVRAVLQGSAARPRLSIFRSNRHIFAQLIDDMKGKTLCSASTYAMKGKMKKIDAATATGTALAEVAKKAGLKRALVDRGMYRYHGRVKALVEAARKGGLEL